MQSVYQGVDWRDKAMWRCNGGRNPLGSGIVADVPMSPFELLFVKVKAKVLERGDHLSKAALAYDSWLGGPPVRLPPSCPSVLNAAASSWHSACQQNTPEVAYCALH